MQKFAPFKHHREQRRDTVGYFMAYADIQIPSLLGPLHPRFAPAQPELGGDSL